MPITELLISFIQACTPGPRSFECVAWMEQCLPKQMALGWDQDSAWENCVEMIPASLWPTVELPDEELDFLVQEALLKYQG